MEKTKKREEEKEKEKENTNDANFSEIINKNNQRQNKELMIAMKNES